MKIALRISIALTFVAILFASTACDDNPASPYDGQTPSFKLERYLGHDIWVVTEVYGEFNDRAQVTFETKNGDVFGLFVFDPANNYYRDYTFSEGLQKLKIFSVQYTPPNQFVPGQVHVDCEYSDKLGGNYEYYVGLVSAWIY